MEKIMENVETIKYKGFDIEICQDDFNEGPEDWGDEGLFLVNYHNDFFVENEAITKEELTDLFNGEKIEQTKEYHIFLLSSLVHSGVWLSLQHNFACDSGGWDTSHIGAVLVSKKETRYKKKAFEMAEGLVKTWNDYLSGNVYGYNIEGLDSCWGFYGDYLTSGVIDEAKDIIDYEVERRTKKHLKRLRAYIKNNVSLENRKPLEATMFS